jgi:hypothetical protein
MLCEGAERPPEGREWRYDPGSTQTAPHAQFTPKQFFSQRSLATHRLLLLAPLATYLALRLMLSGSRNFLPGTESLY